VDLQAVFIFYYASHLKNFVLSGAIWMLELIERLIDIVIIIIIIIIILMIGLITRTVFMVLSAEIMAQSHCVRVHPVHSMNAEQRYTAADLSTDLSHWPACRQL